MAETENCRKFDQEITGGYYSVIGQQIVEGEEGPKLAELGGQTVLRVSPVPVCKCTANLRAAIMDRGLVPNFCQKGGEGCEVKNMQ